MIISRTPLRVSFFGGGTDYSEYFSKHGGTTLVTAIDRFSYISVSPLTEFFDFRIRVSYSRTELVREVNEIQHPAVRECLKFMGIPSGIQIHYMGDLPARTGLGSSSSFTVGLLHALHAYKGEMVSAAQLAAEAIHIEKDVLGERVGVQDQYACAYGGLQLLEFGQDMSVRVTPVIIAPQRLLALQRRLLMFYTGITRSAHEVLEQQIRRTLSGQVNHELGGLAQLVSRGLDVLCNDQDLSEFGRLLNEGWILKRRLSNQVSNNAIDLSYERALRAGATGGKLLGAGGGGFLLLYVEPDDQPSVRSELSDLREVQFAFYRQGTGIIFYGP